jgi:hypothetical protein
MCSLVSIVRSLSIMLFLPPLHFGARLSKVSKLPIQSRLALAAPEYFPVQREAVVKTTSQVLFPLSSLRHLLQKRKKKHTHTHNISSNYFKIFLIQLRHRNQTKKK